LDTNKSYKPKKYSRRTTKIYQLIDIDRMLCSLFGSFRFLKYITPLNADYWKKLYIQKGTQNLQPNFVYREAEIDFKHLRSCLSMIIPEDDTTLLLSLKAREMMLFLNLIECRNSSEFTEISKYIYGTVDDELLSLAKNWLELADEKQTEFHYNSKQVKYKLEAEIKTRKLNVKVKLRKHLSSKAAAGVKTIGLQANARFSYEDFLP